jgi:hypothetical protein
MNCAECMTGQTLSALQVANNKGSMHPISSERFMSDLQQYCGSVAAEEVEFSTWPEEVASTGCPLLDLTLYNVEVPQNA